MTGTQPDAAAGRTGSRSHMAWALAAAVVAGGVLAAFPIAVRAGVRIPKPLFIVSAAMVGLLGLAAAGAVLRSPNYWRALVVATAWALSYLAPQFALLDRTLNERYPHGMDSALVFLFSAALALPAIGVATGIVHLSSRGALSRSARRSPP